MTHLLWFVRPALDLLLQNLAILSAHVPSLVSLFLPKGLPIMFSKLGLLSNSFSSISFKLYSLRVNFLLNVEIFVFLGDKSWQDPLNCVLPLICFWFKSSCFLRKDRFWSPSRYIMEFSWIAVDGKLKHQS